MKFTKEEAFEKLKGILTNNGKKTLRMSEKSIQAQLETLIPLLAVEDTELTDFVEKVKDTFSVMNSNAEFDNSEFVKKWEMEHPVTNNGNQGNEGAKGSEGLEGNGSHNNPNPELKALMDQVNQLKAKMDEDSKKKAIETKKNEFIAELTKKGIKDKTWTEMYVKKITISEDMNIESEADDALKFYNLTKSSDTGNFTPFGTSGGNKDNTSKMFDDIKADFEREQKRNQQ